MPRKAQNLKEKKSLNNESLKYQKLISLEGENSWKKINEKRKQLDEREKEMVLEK